MGLEPAVVLMDYNMPQKNGLEAVHEIRIFEQTKKLPPLPIFLHTSEESIDGETVANEAFLNKHLLTGYLAKNFPTLHGYREKLQGFLDPNKRL
jgi:CheY-like chemotaxis protein